MNRGDKVQAIAMNGVTWLRQSVIVLLLAAAPGALVAQSAQELFQQALVTERSAGKLPDAIALYQRAVQGAPIDGSPPTRFDFDAQYVNHLRLSRDGRRLAFVARDPSRSQPPSI